METSRYFCAIVMENLTLLHIIAPDEIIAHEIAKFIFHDGFDVYENGTDIYKVPVGIKEIFKQYTINQGYIISNNKEAIYYSTRKNIIDEILNEIQISGNE